VDTTGELKQLIEYWISHSHEDASIYEEWAERLQELDPDDTLADVLRKAAIDHSHRRASIYEECAKRVQELDQGDPLADGLRKAAKKIYQSVQDLEVVVNVCSHNDFDE
jgi:formate dehydrogenase maturation protein FdhE